MAVALSRRELLRRAPIKRPSLLPPWALQFNEFSKLCDGCGDCIQICPPQILALGADNLATINFTNNACVFCGKCEEACQTGALDLSQGPAWQHKAQIENKCLSLLGVVCRLCEEACEVQAISFQLMLEGRSVPIVNKNQCNGCGGCLAVCPVEAVSFTSFDNKEQQ